MYLASTLYQVKYAEDRYPASILKNVNVYKGNTVNTASDFSPVWIMQERDK